MLESDYILMVCSLEDLGLRFQKRHVILVQVFPPNNLVREVKVG